MAVVLGEHQLRALETLSNGRILAGGVGSGKSRTALAYWYYKVCEGSLPINGEGLHKPMAKPKDVYVITTAKKRDSLDWEEEALDFKVGPEKNPQGVKLVVDSWHNIKRYKDVTDAFFIFDEQRLVGSGVWVDTFLKLVRHNEWILLSATPGDTWLDYIPVFVANGFYRNRTDFKREHVIYNTRANFPKVERYVGVRKLERFRSALLVEMPLERGTSRFLHFVTCWFDAEAFKRLVKTRWNPFKDGPIESLAELYYTMRRITNADESRLKAVLKLREKHPRLIIFYNFDYELEALRALSLVAETKEWNGHKHEPLPTGERWNYLVQYAAGNEAWNCITTDTMVFYSLNYSYRVLEQCQGRIDRLNTPYTILNYYILVSDAPIDQDILRCLRNKESFQESRGRWQLPSH